MKIKKKSQKPIDPPKEELAKLKSALSDYNSLLKEKEEFQGLFDEANAEVDAYSINGDLRDTKTISSLLVRQTQASLVARRLTNIGERLAEADEKLSQEAKVVTRLLVGALYSTRNGKVERAARSMRPHFDDFQACRRQAFQTSAAQELNARIYSIENLGLNLETIQIVEELLKIGPKILAELAAISKELGGEIPSESELRAV